MKQASTSPSSTGSRVSRTSQVVRGIVPDSFAQAVPEKIAFLHIDMNSSKAEIAALEHRCSTG